ncbi:hypothetical protein [Bacillus sp. NPDC093026]|uniref:hypothetical protein n=1 Tax=Bacillus sp. NPDC093026 TaxID=3363948 RepID=UPI003817BFA9
MLVVVNQKKYDFSNINNSAFSIGDNSTNISTNNINKNDDQFLKLTQTLMQELKKSELATPQQEEVEELVDAIVNGVNEPQPKKAIIRSLVDSANSIIQLGANSTNLITAFEKWSTYISQALGG